MSKHENRLRGHGTARILEVCARGGPGTMAGVRLQTLGAFFPTAHPRTRAHAPRCRHLLSDRPSHARAATTFSSMFFPFRSSPLLPSSPPSDAFLNPSDRPWIRRRSRIASVDRRVRRSRVRLMSITLCYWRSSGLWSATRKPAATAKGCSARPGYRYGCREVFSVVSNVRGNAPGEENWRWSFGKLYTYHKPAIGAVR